jgi:hypothetical protein
MIGIAVAACASPASHPLIANLAVPLLLMFALGLSNGYIGTIAMELGLPLDISLNQKNQNICFV